jgi:hypothetical protein
MSVNDLPRIVIYDSRVMLQIVTSLSGDSRGVIYYPYMFIVQAIEQYFKQRHDTLRDDTHHNNIQHNNK